MVKKVQCNLNSQPDQLLVHFTALLVDRVRIGPGKSWSFTVAFSRTRKSREKGLYVVYYLLQILVGLKRFNLSTF